ncbi:thioesterase II family protein [Ruminococcus gauvreauii]|uniref:thioesterase II family protein n=1 Tax=Ruminococcus gauvreauii TaxID=438033 RepID=UPI003984466C
MKKRIQLFCLPFAGGSRASFKRLEQMLQPWIDVYTIEYPGRGTRINETFADSWESLMEDVSTQILSLRSLELPFAILGYSMGAAIAYEMLQYQMDEKPIHAFLCARGCGGRFDLPGELKSKEEAAIELQALGGIDERIVNDKRLMNLFIRPVYEDYKLLNQYCYKKEMGMPNINFSVIYCEEDTSYSVVKEWNNRTTGQTEFFEMGHNHFFIRDCVEELADIIQKNIFYNS